MPNFILNLFILSSTADFSTVDVNFLHFVRIIRLENLLLALEYFNLRIGTYLAEEYNRGG